MERGRWPDGQPPTDKNAHAPRADYEEGTGDGQHEERIVVRQGSWYDASMALVGSGGATFMRNEAD